MRPETLDAAVEGQDAVITSVSVGNALKEGRKPTTLFSKGTSNVIAAMKKQRPRLGDRASLDSYR
jgi:hypothetical protein